MWNKIGEFLGYPDTWCEFVAKLVLSLIILIAFIVIVVFVFVPVMIWFGVLDHLNTVQVVTLHAVSLVLAVLLHVVLADLTDWYPKLISKLPDCPKIKWSDKHE